MSRGNINAIIRQSANLFYDKGSGYTYAGLSKDGVKVKLDPKFIEIKADQTGDTPVEYVSNGTGLTVEFNALETTLDLLADIGIPGSVLYTDGTSKALGVGSVVGRKMSSYAVKLKIHPLNTLGTDGADDETVLTEDITVWKAVSMNAIELNQTSQSERVYAIVLTGMPDSTKASDYNLNCKGDPALLGTLDVTPPSTVSSAITGTAQNGAATTITLAAAASSTDDYYNGMTCYVTGKGHAVITDYVGSTKVATVADWLGGADPTTGDTYALYCKNVKVEISDTMTLIAPVDAALAGVDADTNIEIIFSEELDSGAAVNPANFILKDDASYTSEALVAASLAYDSTTKKVTINPPASLTTGHTYSLIVHGMKDLTGNQMITPEVVKFTIA